MILTVIPHDEGTDLGRAYNEAMRRLGDDDWACFLDHDAMFTTRTWHAQMRRAIEERPDAGLFGVMTNRAGNPDQELPGVDRDDHDVAYHRQIGAACAGGGYGRTSDWPEYLDLDQPGRNWIAGVVMLTSKRAWSEARSQMATGVPSHGFREGYFLGVDNEYHKAVRRAGYKAYLLTRVYVYHWYRARGDDAHVQDLPRSAILRP